MAKAMPKDGCHGRLLELFHAWIAFKLLFSGDCGMKYKYFISIYKAR
jgi:hypothetical protein